MATSGQLRRDFAELHVRPVAHALNNTPESLEAFPRKLVTQMAEAGLFRIPFAEEYGGAGLQYPLEAIYRYSKIGEIYEGANEVQQLIIARQISAI